MTRSTFAFTRPLSAQWKIGLIAGLVLIAAAQNAYDVFLASAGSRGGQFWMLAIAVGVPLLLRLRLPLTLLFWAQLLTYFIPPAPSTIGERELAFGGLLFFAGLGTIGVGLLRRPTWPASLNSLAVPGVIVVCLWSLPLTWLANGTTADWLRAVAPFAVLVVAYITTTVAIRHFEDIQVLLHCILAAAILYATNTLFLFAAYQQWAPNARVTFLDPATTVPAPLVGAVVALGLWLFAPAHQSPKLYLTTFLLCSTAILATLSRGMSIGLLSGVGALWATLWIAKARSQQRRLTTLLLRALSFGGIALVWSGGLQIIYARLSDTSVNDQARLAEYAAALDQFWRSPLWGSGLGTGFVIPFYIDFGLEPTVNSVHNVVFYFLAKTGLIGTLLLGVWFLAAVQDARLLIRNRQSSLTWSVGCIILATLVALFIYALTFAVYRLFYYNILLGILLAVLSQARALEGKWAGPMLNATQQTHIEY
jgi:O-antigen ligase